MNTCTLGRSVCNNNNILSSFVSIAEILSSTAQPYNKEYGTSTSSCNSTNQNKGNNNNNYLCLQTSHHVLETRQSIFYLKIKTTDSIINNNKMFSTVQILIIILTFLSKPVSWPRNPVILSSICDNLFGIEDNSYNYNK